jgi:hypoxanthine phosphoribosyltransferase
MEIKMTEKSNEARLKWVEVELLCRDVAQQLKGKYDVVVPISRGGLCPGAIIANMIGVSNVRPIRWQTRDGNCKDKNTLQEIVQTYERVLIVDDLLDSGQCLKEISESIREVKTPVRDVVVTYAVLLKNISYEQHTDEMYNIVYGQRFDGRTDKRWIIFPWESVS